jgi:hypothetical protein
MRETANAKQDRIDLALREIASMVEFARRITENITADDDHVFKIQYDEMNLLDFAICDLAERMQKSDLAAGMPYQRARGLTVRPCYQTRSITWR